MLTMLASTAGEAAAAGAVALGIVTVLAIIALAPFIPAIILCLILQSTMGRIPFEHRQLAPGLIWLLLIPIFGIFWNFYVFTKIPDSYASFFRAANRPDVGDAGRGLGMAYSILITISVFGWWVPLVGCVAWACGPAAFVVLIIFLVKIFGLRAQIPPA